MRWRSLDFADAGRYMQFRLRTLLISVAAVALGAAAIAPWFRGLDELTQMRLVLIFGALGVVNLVSFAILAALVQWECRKAGECWKVINTRLHWHFVDLITWSALAIAFTLMLVWEITYETSRGRGMDRILADAFVPIFFLSYWLPCRILNRRITRICFHERGVIFGSFIPRTSISSWRWVRDQLSLLLEKNQRREIPIRSDDRAELETILQRWDAANACSRQPIAGTTRTMLLSIPIMFFVPLVLMVWHFVGPTPNAAPGTSAQVPAVVAPTNAP